MVELTHRQTGERLYLSPGTVEHHVARIRRKLGVHSHENLLLVLREVLGRDQEPDDA